MAHKSKLSANQRNLIRRYLIWFYKTTKEDLDRIDRYFTQFKADQYILKCLRQSKDYQFSKGYKEYRKRVDAFEGYLLTKKARADKQKFKDSQSSVLTSEYQYLLQRCDAIEKAIRHFLGGQEMRRSRGLYEKEMTVRILSTQEHS